MSEPKRLTREELTAMANRQHVYMSDKADLLGHIATLEAEVKRLRSDAELGAMINRLPQLSVLWRGEKTWDLRILSSAGRCLWNVENADLQTVLRALLEQAP